MRVLTVKGTNVAHYLISDKKNVVLAQVDSDMSASGKGTTVSVEGEVAILAQHYEYELHNDVLEQRMIGSAEDDLAVEYTCLKGTDIKVEDFVHDKYTYDGSAWGTA
tara:strand:+ start:182 stop:502 length:321 start_codon:yes stop_codon:yes gene_type:complete